MSNNALTAWIAEFKHHQHDAKPAEAWTYLTTIVLQLGISDWLIGHDSERDEVIYRPSQRTEPRRIRKASFRRQFERTRQIA